MKHRRDRRSPQASGSLSQQQRFAQPGINMDMPSRHSGERPFPVPPQGDFSMLNGRQGTDDLSSSDGSLERNRQMPSTSQQVNPACSKDLYNLIGFAICLTFARIALSTSSNINERCSLSFKSSERKSELDMNPASVLFFQNPIAGLQQACNISVIVLMLL